MKNVTDAEADKTFEQIKRTVRKSAIMESLVLP